MKDYTAHIFSGAPKKVSRWMKSKICCFSRLKKIKTGDFDEWMITAVINDLKKQWQSVLENSNALATTMYDSFIQERSWQQTISELDEMSKITKADLMKFANDNYGDNYVIVYKNQGENKDLVRVENPGITPISLNRENESQFYKDFQKMTEKPILRYLLILTNQSKQKR